MITLNGIKFVSLTVDAVDIFMFHKALRKFTFNVVNDMICIIKRRFIVNSSQCRQ